ncbi:Txe/YoeB family addiction module toxin [Desulfonatronum thiodismutans]|uniref:Txe/YoeB family addiction module toxin n=1 Tax=Desulfonatronum thiodismutans TaxID=159290 RepID=UPI0004ABEC90|nr:Txe/YoeB family addiction module toxin [Desulfonatronum thiodismutans]
MLIWHDSAWKEYMYWQSQDKKTLKRINLLLKEIARDPYEGTGKPEALKGNLSGFWSRRIDEKNRLVYRIVGEDCQIAQCRGHYGEE